MHTQQIQLNSLVTETRQAVAEHAEGYAVGLLDEADFAARMADTLEAAHTRAVVLGRRRAGDFAPEEADDAKYAQHVMTAQEDFLAGFVSDLEAGRYLDADGNPRPEHIQGRAELYADRLTGTANEVFGLASEDDVLWDWRLGGVERHCEDCPDLAASGPYRWADLPAVPGDGSTQCVTNCACEVVRSDGQEGFKRTD